MNTTGQTTVVILGGGTGGLVAASKLKKKVGKKTRVILIDKNPNHIYAPSFLWLMTGRRSAKQVQRPLSRLIRKGIEFVHDEIVRINVEDKIIVTNEQSIQYDYLVIALGADLAPEKMPGLAQSGYNLYELPDVERLRDDLKLFRGGKVAVVIASLPFKCPAAPYEAAFLLDEYFAKRGVRDKTEISIYTPEPLPIPATGPENGKAVREIIEARNIKFNPEVQLVSVDPNTKQLVFENGRSEHFDFLVFVPPHQGPKVVRESKIGNDMGWISVDNKTLKTKYENVFAIGDVAAISLVSGKPLPRAGVFAHLEAEVVVANIDSNMKGLPADKEFDGHGFCFLETGYGKAGLASGNFYAEPVPVVKMKRPGRMWHWGKVLFEKYWLRKWF
ncbi:MAG: NAD(P)/FAD-dependent oxidoreductase [Ilumatobacteraceae bacterium]